MYTKREIVEAAFEEIGLASYTFDLSPEQLQSAMRKLDRMAAVWNNRGVRLGYPLPSSPSGSDLDDDTNVPDSANDALILNLAIIIAPSLGKVVSPDTKAAAKSALQGLMNKSAFPIEKRLPSMPAGAGRKLWRDRSGAFIDKPSDTLDVGPDGELELG